MGEEKMGWVTSPHMRIALGVRARQEVAQSESWAGKSRTEL